MMVRRSHVNAPLLESLLVLSMHRRELSGTIEDFRKGAWDVRRYVQNDKDGCIQILRQKRDEGPKRFYPSSRGSNNDNVVSSQLGDPWLTSQTTEVR
jgi:hypothetical protein